MRQSICCLISTLELLSFSARVLPAESDESLAIPDPALKAAIEDALWVVNPTAADMLALIELSYVPAQGLHELQVIDLTGLGQPNGCGPQYPCAVWIAGDYLTPDRLELYFDSNRPDGLGGWDTWWIEEGRDHPHLWWETEANP